MFKKKLSVFLLTLCSVALHAQPDIEEIINRWLKRSNEPGLVQKVSLISQGDDERQAAAAYLYLGECWLAQKNFLKAEQHFQRALQYDNRQIKARVEYQRGCICIQQGNAPQAKIHYQNAIQVIDSSSVRAKAESWLKQILALEKIEQGNTCTNQREFDQAKKHYEAAIKLLEDPEQKAKVTLRLQGVLTLEAGITCFQQNNLSQAKVHLQKLLSQQPQGINLRAVAESYMAGICMQQANYPQVATHCRNVLQYLDNHHLDAPHLRAKTECMLGDACALQGENSQAVTHYNNALRCNDPEMTARITNLLEGLLKKRP